MSTSLTQSSGQSDSGRFEFSLKTGNPAAQQLMNEDFFWSPIEESGPFGSDDGSDAAYGFRVWRMSHPLSAPVSYLNELIARWDYPVIALDEMDTIAISKYLKASVPMDEAKILEVFEGKIDSSLRTLSEIAIRRELMGVLLTHFPENYRNRRKFVLEKMLSIIQKMAT